MSQLINLVVLNKGLCLTQVFDYPPNSLLILVKEDTNNTDVLFIKYSKLISGTRNEYFKYMAENFDFNYYHIVHGEIEAGNIEVYIHELSKYEKQGDFILYPQKRFF